MTDAEIAHYREIVARERMTSSPVVLELVRACHALLAHIDTLTAEIIDREGKYVDLLRTKHALVAEVERLHGYLDNMAIIETGLELERDSLRDLVREAGEIIERGSFCGCETYRPLGHSPNCGQKRAAAWQKKAQQ